MKQEALATVWHKSEAAAQLGASQDVLLFLEDEEVVEGLLMVSVPHFLVSYLVDFDSFLCSVTGVLVCICAGFMMGRQGTSLGVRLVIDFVVLPVSSATGSAHWCPQTTIL